MGTTNSLYTAVLALLIPTTLYLVSRIWAPAIPKDRQDGHKSKSRRAEPASLTPEMSACVDKLASSLPESVIMTRDSIDFEKRWRTHWADQINDAHTPACVVRPRDTADLGAAMAIIKQTFDKQQQLQDSGKTAAAASGGLFAVRSGGHSLVPGASSTAGGVLIDLGAFDQVEVSDDRASVVIGTGARWGDVYAQLDEHGLTVAGGRDADVGVGGLILGGGLSFYTPRVGLASSNIHSYEVVLASGAVVTASGNSPEHRDLWLALQGGTNNFGVVTRFTAASIPAPSSSPTIWGGTLAVPHFESRKVLAGLHACADRPWDSGAHLIVAFIYHAPMRFHGAAVLLTHTRPETSTTNSSWLAPWPKHWRDSPFSLSKMWRLTSTCAPRSQTSLAQSYSAGQAPGSRQAQGVVMVRNDMATLEAARAASEEAVAALRAARPKVKGLVWSFVMQPLLPEWVRGRDGIMGLEELDGPHVVVCTAVKWEGGGDDELVEGWNRWCVDRVEAVARERGTLHAWKYPNYCGGWQRPFESYGEENLGFLRETSGRYDPDGLFQRGCVGGFKLWPEGEASD